MRTRSLLLVIAIIALSAFTLRFRKDKVVKVEEFKKFIDTIGLVFDMPPGYKETAVLVNKDLWYSFAIKNKNADFQVRYTVWSLKPEIEAFKKCKLDSNCYMLNPNVIYQGRIQANVLNMTSGEESGIGPFPAQAVKKEFNADAGGSSFFEFKCDFGKGYKYGQMVYLHKDDVADVIISYMSNDRSTHSDLMDVPFHALKFK